MKKILTTFAALLMVVGLFAQSPAKYWQDFAVEQMNLPEGSELTHEISSMRSLSLNYDGMKEFLLSAPSEGDEAAYLELELPMPDGSTEKYKVFNSPIMEPGLAAEYPEIRTFAGNSLEGNGGYLRFVFSPTGGFYGLVISDEGTVRISPYVDGQVTYYKSYFTNDIVVAPDAEMFECGVSHEDEEAHLLDESHLSDDNLMDSGSRNPMGITDRYEYRIAVATTGEFFDANGGSGGSVSNVLTYVTEVMSDINVAFNRDAGIKLNLIDNTTDLFFDNGGTDPYTNGNTEAMLNENPGVINGIISSSDYDIGHVFGTNAGGLANLGSVCSGMNKARGASCQFGPMVGDNFFLIPAHEMGHQFNATHTFNKCDGDNETPSTGYEPGAGSTIMCYSGASDCSSQWMGNMNDPYFHNNSMGRIQEFSRDPLLGGACAEEIPVGNNMPDVTVPFGDGVTIPISTPFELTAEGSDVDGDDVTYCWEQYDLGPPSDLGSPIGSAPAFRSYFPTDSPTRVFPRIERVVMNTNHPHEVLPTYSRDLTFRCSVRDNNEDAGAYAYEEIAFNAVESAGPFLVMNPNAGTEEWEVGAFVEVTWDVANTDAMPVNCQTVNIRLSLDGGYTYPVTLLTDAPNDGMAMVTVPNELTDMARVRVEAADNIFFDISNNNFSIIPGMTPGFALTVTPQVALVCLPEAFDASIETESLVGFSESINLSVTGLPAGAVENFSSNPVTPGDNANLSIDMSAVDVSGDFTITLIAEADGVPTAERTIDLTLIDNDFSAIQLLTPAGASGTGTLPDFSWSDLPNALTYNIQIATDPAFNNIVEENTDINGTTYTPSIQLEDDEVYYWQISVNNECGAGPWSLASAFQTVSQTCQTASDAPASNIPSGNGTLRTSTVSFSTGGEISDVNVTNVSGDYNTFGDLEIRLKHGGETVKLASGESCFVFSDINVGFDDEAPPADLPCPPDNGQSYQPADALSVFDGGNAQGDWTLEIEVITSLGDGGNFDSWELEVCGASQANDPYLVTNETLLVPPNESRLVFIDKLEVRDDDNISQELQFTIIDDVEHGVISLESTPLGVGDHFTMTDVYGSRVTYTNTNDAALTDRFTFTVHDPDGGFFGTPAFNIVIDADAPIDNLDEVLNSDELFVYPNPTSNLLNVEFVNQVKGNVKATIFNAQGQLLLARDFDFAGGKIQLELGDLPAGFHLLQVTTENGIYTKKVMVD